MPRSQVFTQKDTQIGIKLQTTPIDREEYGEGKADAHGTGEKEHNDTIRYRKGTGPPVDTRRRGEQACGWWRQADRGRDPWTG